MTLGAFLLLIFILWLIDKHNLWRKALKVFLILVVLVILGGLGLWLYDRHETKRTEAEQAAEQQAEAVFKRTQLSDCIKRLTDTPPDGTTLQVDAKTMCEENPNAAPSDAVKWYKMRASDGKWYKTLALSPEQALSKMEKTPSRRQKAALQLHHLFAKHDLDLDTTEFGGLVCAHLAKGETVTLLEDDSIWVRLKTQSGKTGWAQSSDFEMTD